MTHQLYDYIGGKIWLDVDESEQMAARARSEYEPNKVRAMQDFLKPGMTFVDVGACHGYFTLLAAKLVGPTGRVLAFEPEPVNCGWLRKSVTTNKYKNVDVYEIPLSNSRIGCPLWLGEKSGHHSLWLTKGKHRLDNCIPVDCQRFDEVVETKVDAAKIDTEGSELDVLIGMRKSLSHDKPTLLMYDVHYGIPGCYTADSLAKELIRQGFSPMHDGISGIVYRNYYDNFLRRREAEQ